jgi:hypothetical protein
VSEVGMGQYFHAVRYARGGREGGNRRPQKRMGRDALAARQQKKKRKKKKQGRDAERGRGNSGKHAETKAPVQWLLVLCPLPSCTCSLCGTAVVCLSAAQPHSTDDASSTHIGAETSAGMDATRDGIDGGAVCICSIHACCRGCGWRQGRGDK